MNTTVIVNGVPMEFSVNTNPEFSLNSGWNKLTDLYLFSTVKHEHKITEDLWTSIYQKYEPEKIEITVACGVMVIHLFNPTYI